MKAPDYQPSSLTREDIDALAGRHLLMFGASWCSHCQAAQSATLAALEHFPDVVLTQIEDGKGRPLGRSFSVKLWPTLVFLKDGQEVARLVRPVDTEPIQRALALLSA